MRTSTVLAAVTALAAASALLLSEPSLAEGRDNPFAPPSTKAEEQARQEERVRQIIREMVPEVESRVMRNVAQTQAESEVRLRRRLDEISTRVPDAGQAGQAAPGAPGASAPRGAPGGQPTPPPAPTTLPEGAKFISCVNGKALYRDKDNALFQVSPGSGIEGANRCAR